jgi:hypothetical protein
MKVTRMCLRRSHRLSPHPSVRMNNSSDGEMIIIKYDIGEFHQHFSKRSNTGYNGTKITGILYGDFPAYLYASQT